VKFEPKVDVVEETEEEMLARFAARKAELKAIRDANVPEVDWIHNANVYFDWHWMGMGFGQLSFSFDREARKIECMNECMSRESVRKLLHAMADFVADRAVLLDNPEDLPLKELPNDTETEYIELTQAP
jgi:hypothetical protein